MPPSVAGPGLDELKEQAQRGLEELAGEKRE
jgi:hypothetical protein